MFPPRRQGFQGEIFDTQELALGIFIMEVFEISAFFIFLRKILKNRLNLFHGFDMLLSESRMRFWAVELGTEPGFYSNENSRYCFCKKKVVRLCKFR
jgi:hypothetical protein